MSTLLILRAGQKDEAFPVFVGYRVIFVPNTVEWSLRVPRVIGGVTRAYSDGLGLPGKEGKQDGQG